MPQLYLFNPGHEMEILCGKSHYTPPYSVQKMSADLEMLPIWYGGAGSFTLVRNPKASQFVASLPKVFRPSLSSPMILNLMMKELYRRKKLGTKPKLPPLTASIWGVSPRSTDAFKELKQAGMDLEITEWKEEYVLLTNRYTSAVCLENLQKAIPITPAITIPVFLSNLKEIEDYVANHTPPFVIKTPFSSSGRGHYWVNDNKLDNRAVSWLNGSLKKQSVVSIEPALTRIFDFAAEFYSDGKGQIQYEGLSIFETQSQGQFVGCMLGTQEMLLQQLSEYISPENYLFLVEQIGLILMDTVANTYCGYMGVDMFIYKTDDGNYAVHPFVELNLRYTMGLAAMQISRQFVHPQSHGMMRTVTYMYNAFQEHQRMQAEAPLVLDENLIRSGYQTLCPVGPDTRYMAIMTIFE
jgi:hypothetical protein